MFKKEKEGEVKKGRGKNLVEEQTREQEMANGVEQAFGRVFLWGKLAVDLEGSSGVIQVG
jgi:hypothetical protein